MSPTVDALSRGPKYISDPEEDSRLDYLASPELVDILTKFMLGGRSPQQVEEGVEHPLDPNRDRTTYLSQQPPPRDLLGSAMERGNPLAWMEQVQEPENVPEAGLIEKIARKGPQLLEQLAIMAGSAKGAKGGTRMQWEPKFGSETLKTAPSESRKPPVEPSPELVSALAAKGPASGTRKPLRRSTFPVELDYKDGTEPVVDIVKGSSWEDALANAKSRWPSAEIRQVEPTDSRVQERKDLIRRTSQERGMEKEQRSDFYGVDMPKGSAKGGGDTIRVYSGGTSAPSDFWSENPGRAASFGPNVWVVEIPRSVFEAGKAQAAKLGQPTKWDTVLPNEWVKKSSQVPSENLGTPAEPSVNIQSTPRSSGRTLVKVGGSSGGRGETFASRSPGEYEIRENGELAGSIWSMKDPRFRGGPQVWHATIGGETRKFQSFSEAKAWALSK